ncbi:MAG: nitroreductase family protein [Promethearchaeati archaeon]
MQNINNSLIEVDRDKCTKCKACIKACPAQLFFIESDNLEITGIFEDTCIQCGHCVAICPVEAIRLKKYDQDLPKVKQIKKNLPNFDSFRNLTLIRRSKRQFKDKVIPKGDIETLLNLTRHSPTAKNTQNVFFSVVQDKEVVSKISKEITNNMQNFVNMAENERGKEILKTQMSEKGYNEAIEMLPQTKWILEKVNQGVDFWCWNGQLISIHGKEEIGGISQDCSLAATYIMLGAELLGLGTCSLGYLTYFSNRSKKIKKLMKIPNDHRVGYSLAIGYPKANYTRVPPREDIKIEWV